MARPCRLEYLTEKPTADPCYAYFRGVWHSVPLTAPIGDVTLTDVMVKLSGTDGNTVNFYNVLLGVPASQFDGEWCLICDAPED